MAPAIPLTEKSVWLTVSLPGFQPAGQTERNKNWQKDSLKTDFSSLQQLLVFLFPKWNFWKEPIAMRTLLGCRPLDYCLPACSHQKFQPWSLSAAANLCPFLPIMSSYIYNIRNQVECAPNKVGRFGNLVNRQVGAWQNLWIYINFQYKLIFCFLQYCVLMPQFAVCQIRVQITRKVAFPLYLECTLTQAPSYTFERNI